MKKVKGILIKALIVMGSIIGTILTTIIILVVVQQRQYRQRAAERATWTPAPYVMPELGFVVEDSDEPLEIDTYSVSELTSHKRIYIYDAAYLDLFFDYESVTPEETKQVVAKNDAISPKFKELLYWYVDAFASTYPDADMRILHYNLQTLEVVERSGRDLVWDTLSVDSYGCYVRSENKIYVNTDYEYEPGTWDYQVIIHEFSHAARSIQRDFEDMSVRIELSKKYMEIPEEALNSLFAVSLFDYEELDIGYQLQSNYFMMMLECLDDYDLGDYINHSLSYLAHKLDAQNGDNNYALTIFKLIEEQRKDYKDDRYEREQEVYYPIYDYICKMYLEHYAGADASAEEINALVNELLDRVLYDVPEEYHIDTDEFYRFAEEYISAVLD